MDILKGLGGKGKRGRSKKTEKSDVDRSRSMSGSGGAHPNKPINNFRPVVQRRDFTPKQKRVIPDVPSVLEPKSFDLSTLPQFTQNYTEYLGNPITDQTLINTFYTENNVTTNVTQKSPVVLSMDQTNFPEECNPLLVGVKQPLPLQSICWPLLLSAKNVFATSDINSGRLYSYLIPSLLIAKKCHAEKTGPGPSVMIVTHRYNMVDDIAAKITDFCAQNELKVLKITGKIAFDDSIAAAQGDSDICVCTVIRLLDFLGRKVLSTDNCRLLVCSDLAESIELDKEWDKRLPSIFGQFRPDTIFSLFSSTTAQKCVDLVGKINREFVTVKIGDQFGEIDFTKITMRLHSGMSPQAKEKQLVKVIKNNLGKRGVVFVSTAEEAESVCEKINFCGVGVGCLTDIRGKKYVLASINAFKNRKYEVLVVAYSHVKNADLRLVDFAVFYELSASFEFFKHAINKISLSYGCVVDIDFGFEDYELGKEMLKFCVENNVEGQAELKKLVKKVKDK